ncbi:FGGY-family carbohydrate kinase, partial [Shigella sonnei]|nr:FGGY-family carbohydrate kinase [Shigella sonnei]
GGAQNPDIMQMQADIFNSEMIRLTVEQGPGLGACMIAAFGCGPPPTEIKRLNFLFFVFSMISLESRNEKVIPSSTALEKCFCS